MEAKTRPKESIVQKKALKFLKRLAKGWFFKTHDIVNAGLPDVLGCYRGYFIALEFKRPDEPQTTLQKVIMATIKVAGGKTCVAESMDDVTRFITEVENA